MSKPWKPPGQTRWLSPEDYAALSAGEKHALWRERQVAPQRYRKGYYARQRWTWMACVMALGFGVTWFGAPDRWIPSMPSAPVASGGAAGVHAQFGSCKWGGGTNCVVDGDTFYIGGQKVRIAGIDAPETHDYACDSELALGNRATEMLQQMLNSGAVTMTSIEDSGQSGTLAGRKPRDRDVYGRLLRNVAVDGQDVGEAMISAGVARAYAGGRRSWC